MAKRNKKKWYRHGSWWRRLWFNRKYKDVLFRHLFRDKQDLLELYNALNDSTYENPEETPDTLCRVPLKKNPTNIASDYHHAYHFHYRKQYTPASLAEKGMVLHMLLTEYDEKKHLKNTFEEGRKEGLEEGIERKLSDQVQKKIAKGKTILEIAEELEEEISVIERLVSRNRKS